MHKMDAGEAGVGPHFVNVPVPADRVLEVYAFLSGFPHAAADATGDSPWTPTPSNGLPTIPWTEEDLARFVSSGTKTSRTVAAVMDVLVEQPGEQFTTTTLVARLGVTRNELRGTFAALTRHIRTHYGRENWPFRFTWGPTLGEDYPVEGHYSIIDPKVVVAWAKLRSNSQPAN
ncbi:MAG: hypothetical protein ACRDJ4_15045 [Actinomycetota bacterium]